MDLIRNIAKNDPQIPNEIMSLFDPKRCTYLFFGFNFENWQFRLLLDSLKLTAESRTLEMTVEPRLQRLTPKPKLSLSKPTEAFFTDEFKFHFIKEDTKIFASQLNEKVASLGDISKEKVYIVCSEKNDRGEANEVDIEIRDRLERSLFPLTRTGVLTIWHRGKLDRGDDLKVVPKENFDQSTIIIILISIEMLADPELWAAEMEWIMERHKNGLVEIIPILASPCQWEMDGFLSKFSPLPLDREGKKPEPITSKYWHESDLAEALNATVDQIGMKLL